MAQIFCFGASIMQGFWDTQGGWVQRLRAYLDKQSMESDDVYYIVHNLGVSGDTAEDILRRFDAEVKARFDKDEAENSIVLLTAGINDSEYLIKEGRTRFSPEEYRKNLSNIIEKAVNIPAKVVVIGLLPIDEVKLNPIPWAPEMAYKTEYVEEFNRIAKETAEQYRCLFIDLYQPLQEQNFLQYLPDGVHPNNEGHQKIYETVAEKLKVANIIA